MTTDTDGVSPGAIDAFVSYWWNTAKKISRTWYFLIDLHGGPTSAVSNVSTDATSYAHRRALLKYEFYDVVDNSATYPAGGTSFLNGFVASILNAMPSVQFGMYINYADSTLTADQAHRAYWLTHYDKLAAIKANWDPRNIFSNPQAVGSGGSTTTQSSSVVASTSTTPANSSTSKSATAKTTSASPITSVAVISASTSTTSSVQASSTVGLAGQWAQCGGKGWTGPIVCVTPYTCTLSNDWYSQCL